MAELDLRNDWLSPTETAPWTNLIGSEKDRLQRNLQTAMRTNSENMSSETVARYTLDLPLNCTKGSTKTTHKNSEKSKQSQQHSSMERALAMCEDIDKQYRALAAKNVVNHSFEAAKNVVNHPFEVNWSVRKDDKNVSSVSSQKSFVKALSSAFPVVYPLGE